MVPLNNPVKNLTVIAHVNEELKPNAKINIALVLVDSNNTNFLPYKSHIIPNGHAESNLPIIILPLNMPAYVPALSCVNPGTNCIDMNPLYGKADISKNIKLKTDVHNAKVDMV